MVEAIISFCCSDESILQLCCAGVGGFPSCACGKGPQYQRIDSINSNTTTTKSKDDELPSIIGREIVREMRKENQEMETRGI